MVSVAATSRPSLQPMAADQARVQTALILFFVYLLSDWLTYQFPGRFGNTPFNPEAAIAVLMLLVCGWRSLPLVVAAVAIGEFVTQTVARPPMAAVFTTLILSAGYAGVAALLMGPLRINLELGTRRDLMRLTAASLLSMLVCGMAYIAVLMDFDVGKGGNYFFATRRFFIGYSMSILAAGPLAFMLFDARRRARMRAYLRTREAWLVLAVNATCIGWVFTQDEHSHVQNFYLLFLPLVWGAARFGMVGAAIGLAALQASLFVAFYLTGYQRLSVFELQLVMMTLAITGLLLGVSIDEQQRATEEARESLKLAAAGEMAAALTHELNQPLTALSGYTTAARLLSGTQDSARLGTTLDKITEESRRAAAVVQRLRDLFRTGATRLEAVSVAELAARQIARSRRLALNAGVTLNLDCAPDLPRVLADPVQIEVVLRNLLSNAIESTAEATHEGTVAVSLTHDAGGVRVTVRDDGAGIREGDTGHIFETFYTSRARGMGMGLAVSRTIIEAHGGRLWAEPGKGGCLIFTLPADLPDVPGRDTYRGQAIDAT